MMTRSQLLAGRIREVLLNGRWIANTNYREQLTGLTREQAIQKIGELNTIAALTYHVNYYLAGILDFFETGKLEISDKYSFDLQPLYSQADWDVLASSFLSNAEKFADYIGQLDDRMLDLPFADEKYGSYLRNIEGVIEHSYYHLGQITLIRKLIAQGHS